MKERVEKELRQLIQDRELLTANLYRTEVRINLLNGLLQQELTKSEKKDE